VRSSTLCRRIRNGRDGEAGFSMAELVIAMGLLSILGVAVAKSYLATSGGFELADSRNQTLREVSVALDGMTKTLQAADPAYATAGVLVSPGNDIRTGDPLHTTKVRNSGIEITFTADLGDPTGPSLVHWYVDDAQQLVQETTPPNNTSAVARNYNVKAVTRRVLATHIVVPGLGERPIFTYFGVQSAKVLNANPDPQVALGYGNTTATVAVQISLTAGLAGRMANVSTLENFVIMPGAMRKLTQGTNWSGEPTNPLPPPTSQCTANCVADPTPTAPTTLPPSTFPAGTGAPTTSKPVPPQPKPIGPPAGLS
jgi:type II secretory pathway pseudopilin PulG